MAQSQITFANKVVISCKIFRKSQQTYLIPVYCKLVGYTSKIITWDDKTLLSLGK